MSGRVTSVPCALQMASTPSTPLRIWKATTSFLGARADIPLMTICRCCARSAIRRSRIDKADRGNMMEYRYFMCGMFNGTDENRYDIYIPSPFVRNLKVETMKDENFAYRFLAIDSAGPMLIAFANEHFEPMNNGKMQLKCWVDKHIIGVYTFEEFKKNGRCIRQLKPSSKKGICYKIKVMINTRVRSNSMCACVFCAFSRICRSLFVLGSPCHNKLRRKR